MAQIESVENRHPEDLLYLANITPNKLPNDTRSIKIGFLRKPFRDDSAKLS